MGTIAGIIFSSKTGSLKSATSITVISVEAYDGDALSKSWTITATEGPIRMARVLDWMSAIFLGVEDVIALI